MIRAKFECWGVEKDDEHTYEDVTLSAVTDGCEENKSFAEATPAGQVNMTISNEAAFGFFQEGKEYYLDFIPVAEARTEAAAGEEKSI